MIPFTAKHGLLAGLALILLSNAVALAGAWYNRQGEPESRLQLTERELWRDHDGPSRENSGLALRLNWRSPRPADASDRYQRANLKQEQLLALGFAPLDEQDQGHYRRRGKRPVLVVLELDGPAYQAELRRSEQDLQRASQLLAQQPDDKQLQAEEKAARKDLTSERNHNSRLFAIDVGLDVASLRQRYPDRTRYALLPGTVSAWCDCSGDVRQLSGQIDPLPNSSLNVPHAWRRQLAERLPAAYASDTPGHFVAHVSIGQRLEPWISNLRELAE